MTTDPIPQGKKFVTDFLPWVAAAAGLALYLVTLSHWVTLNSLLPFARVSGLQWQPVLTSPLYFVLTLPLKLLPAAWIPVAINLFSAVCAALALALLARSVALLPHDRTHPQRMVEGSEGSLLTIRAAWLPVVFAVLVGGLQFTFWEHATAGGPEMLDLLLFAYAVRCLLEYRLDARESWLFQAVFVYAVGMTENWLLILLLPALVTSLIWVMGFSFFNTRFLARAWLLALAGLGFYLLLPLLGMFHQESPISFWPGLKYLLAEQKNTLVAHWTQAQDRLALAALPSLLPLLVIGLKFQTNYGDSSRVGMALTKFSFHVLHAAFLVFCGWVALDPPFSASQLGLSAQFLPLHYLATLGLGYFSGYYLLLFGERAKFSGFHRELQHRRNRTVVTGVWVFALLIVATLLYRNWPLIRAGNGQVLREYASLLTRNLPAKPTILLSDDPHRLWLAQAALAQQPGSPKHLGVDTRLLESPDYHRTLNRQSGGTWPLPPTNQLKSVEHITLIDRMLKQASEREVYYLHPSFGYYFERFRPEPHGIVYKLVPYSTNDVLPPPLSAAVLEENLNFWNEAAAKPLARLATLIRQPDAKTSTNLFERLLARARLAPGASLDAWIASSFHSRSLNDWGVQLQRLGRLEEASRVFARAAGLNPRNVVARINREFNQNLIAGSKATVTLTTSIEDQFGDYRTWNQVLRENGPFDEPTFCYEQGRVFYQSSLYRQALTEFERVRSLVPDDLPSRLYLANIYQTSRLHDQALGVVEEIRAHPDRFVLTSTNRLDLLTLEASAQFGRGDAAAASQVLQAAISRDPTNYNLRMVSAQLCLQHGQYGPALAFVEGIRARSNRFTLTSTNRTDLLALEAAAQFGQGDIAAASRLLQTAISREPTNYYLLAVSAQVYLQNGHPTNALDLFNRQLLLWTNDTAALLNKAGVSMQIGDYRNAIPPLNDVLRFQTNNPEVLLWRAIANLQSDDLDNAQRDYERLLELYPNYFKVLYGLGEVAWRRKDTNAAIRFYESYLANAPPNSVESKSVAERLGQLKPASP